MRFFKGGESCHVNFSFLDYETTKLEPQRIAVKSSEVSYLPLLAELSIRGPSKAVMDFEKVIGLQIQ